MKAYHAGLVDTNILVGASREKASGYGRIKNFVQDLARESCMVVTPQVLLEYYNVMRMAGFGSGRVIKAIEKFGEISKVIYPMDNTYRRALQLARRHKIKGRAKIFDIYLAATAIDNRVKVIYTQNTKDFRMFRGIRAVNPLR